MARRVECAARARRLLRGRHRTARRGRTGRARMRCAGTTPTRQTPHCTSRTDCMRDLERAAFRERERRTPAFSLAARASMRRSGEVAFDGPRAVREREVRKVLVGCIRLEGKLHPGHVLHEYLRWFPNELQRFLGRDSACGQVSRDERDRPAWPARLARSAVVRGSAGPSPRRQCVCSSSGRKH